MRSSYKDRLNAELEAASEYQPPMLEHTGQWQGMTSTLMDGLEGEPEVEYHPQTGVGKELLVDIGKASVKVPDGFVRTLISRLWRRC